jgi:hypothetical protein
MKSAFVLACAIAATCAATAMAEGIDGQVGSALAKFAVQIPAQKQATAAQVADMRREAALEEAALRDADLRDTDIREADLTLAQHRGGGDQHGGGDRRGGGDQRGGGDRRGGGDHRDGGDHRGPDRREPPHREPEHREPQRREPDHRWPDNRRGRWDHGRSPMHPWRPIHYRAYLGFSWDLEECRMFGRLEGYPYVTRYITGDCYGDVFPY